MAGTAVSGNSVVTDPIDPGADLALSVTGDFEGILDIFVEDFTCTPGVDEDTYTETGREVFVDVDGRGTFETS